MIIYLYPKSPFPGLHSDTIFGAIIYAMSQMGDDIQPVIDEFNESPPFLISSAFPFATNKKGKTKFFPKLITEPKKADMDKVKRFKKVMYVEDEIFDFWVSGKTDEMEIMEKLESEYTLHAGKFLISNSKEDLTGFKVESTTLPRNRINRVTQASQDIFHTTLLNFVGGGLFFGVRLFDNSYRSDIIAALKFLRDRGFGEDVSVGMGQFDFEIDNGNIEDQEGDYFVTLSRYIPGKEIREFKPEDMWYEISSKRGRSSNGKIRKQVRFFVEGSTFPEIGRDFYGRAAPSAPDAVEYGYAYKVGLKRDG